ncbi:MAG: ferredoxin [Alphaproteobacteria bacterium]|nr:ferredoxin [Alphaproteobacteria bacterium]
MKRAYVNPDLCIGCGLCVSIVPEVFQLNADGISEVYAETPEDKREEVYEAVDSCPVKAISIIDEDVPAEE